MSDENERTTLSAARERVRFKGTRSVNWQRRVMVVVTQKEFSGGGITHAPGIRG